MFTFSMCVPVASLKQHENPFNCPQTRQLALSINFSSHVTFLPDTVRFGRQRGQCCDAADVRERKRDRDRRRERNAPVLRIGHQVSHISAIPFYEKNMAFKIKCFIWWKTTFRTLWNFNGNVSHIHLAMTLRCSKGEWSKILSIFSSLHTPCVCVKVADKLKLNKDYCVYSSVGSLCLKGKLWVLLYIGNDDGNTLM